MENLFEQYENLAYSIVHKKFKYYSEKEDLIQIALIALWQASKTFNPKFNVGFMCYASSVICNKIKDYIRKQKNNFIVEMREDLELGEYEADLSSLEFDLMIRKLSLLDKELIKNIVYGLKQKEIAEKLGLSQATISRKLKQIKGVLNEKENNNNAIC